MKYTVADFIAALSKLPQDAPVEIYEAPNDARVVPHLFIEETRRGTVLLDGYWTHLDKPPAAPTKASGANSAPEPQPEGQNASNKALERALGGIITHCGGRIVIPEAVLAGISPNIEVHSHNNPDKAEVIFYVR